MDGNYPIDAVITWVDGNDKKHKIKMLPHLEDQKLINRKNRTRFDQVDEIKFTVDSILKFAPFIQNIYIVTDDQIPSFLKFKKDLFKYEKVSIIDHKVIFSGLEEFLPTFNSRSIETRLYKIPNLAEHFIYLNDDMFLVNKTTPSDFFVDGKPVLRGDWKKFYRDEFKKKVKKKIKKTILNKKEANRPNHQVAQQLGAIIFGFNKYYKFDHTPSPLRKSTFENLFNTNSKLEIQNIKYKFRNVNQFIPQGIVNHLEIKNKTCVLKNDLQLKYIECYKNSFLRYKLKLKRRHKNNLFLCLQSLDQCSPKRIEYTLNWLHKTIINL